MSASSCITKMLIFNGGFVRQDGSFFLNLVLWFVTFMLEVAANGRRAFVTM